MPSTLFSDSLKSSKSNAKASEAKAKANAKANANANANAAKSNAKKNAAPADRAPYSEELSNCRKGAYIQWREKCAVTKKCVDGVGKKCNAALEALAMHNGKDGKPLNWMSMWDHQVTDADKPGIKKDLGNAKKCVFQLIWDDDEFKEMYAKLCAKHLPKVGGKNK
jgi:hypothetical protein